MGGDLLHLRSSPVAHTPRGDLLPGWSLCISNPSHGGCLMLFILDFVRQRKIQVFTYFAQRITRITRRLTTTQLPFS